MTISDNSHFDFFPAVNKDYRDFGNFLDIGPRTTGSLRRVGKRRRESGAKISMRANKRAMSRGELARRASVGTLLNRSKKSDRMVAITQTRLLDASISRAVA